MLSLCETNTQRIYVVSSNIRESERLKETLSRINLNRDGRKVINSKDTVNLKLRLQLINGLPLKQTK